LISGIYNQPELEILRRYTPSYPPYFFPHQSIPITLTLTMTVHFGQAPNESIDASTPWTAASEGNLQLLQESLQALNMTPATPDENGYTLLQAAASYSQMNILDWLLAQQVPINATDGEGDSALHFAGSAASAKRLVEAGINVQHRNQEGKTALETKLADLQDYMEDDDVDENDEEIVQLKAVIEYLTGVQGGIQQQ
jgi:Ankyrin repeats (many copies)